MAAKSISLKFRIPEQTHFQLSLYAALKEKSVEDAAQEAMIDWFESIGIARIECSIDRTIAQIQALSDGTPSVQILRPEEKLIN